MKKFLSVLMLCVLLLSVPFEAFAWSDGVDFPNVLVAAARTKKKAPAKKKAVKKQSGPVVRLSRKQYEEFMKTCETGSLEKFTAKFEKENTSPNAVYYGEGGGTETLLTIASMGYPANNVEIVKFLISKGADVNKTIKEDNGVSIEVGTTALMVATENAHLDVVKILLDAGANVNTSTDNGWTALIRAFTIREVLWKDSRKVVEMLLKAGANPNVQTKNDHMNVTPLLLAAERNEKDTPEIIEMLLKAGANAKTKRYDGERAIDYARQNTSLKGTKALKMLEEASR